MATRKPEPEPAAEAAPEVAPQTTPEPPAPEGGGELAEYEVETADGVTLTVQMSEADAKAAGAKAVSKPDDKAATPDNK